MRVEVVVARHVVHRHARRQRRALLLGEQPQRRLVLGGRDAERAAAAHGVAAVHHVHRRGVGRLGGPAPNLPEERRRPRRPSRRRAAHRAPAPRPRFAAHCRRDSDGSQKCVSVSIAGRRSGGGADALRGARRAARRGAALAGSSTGSSAMCESRKFVGQNANPVALNIPSRLLNLAVRELSKLGFASALPPHPPRRGDRRGDGAADGQRGPRGGAAPSARSNFERWWSCLNAYQQLSTSSERSGASWARCGRRPRTRWGRGARR